MNKLVKCKTCDKDIAWNAETCPHCGGMGPSKRRAMIFGFICVTVFTGWWFWVPVSCMSCLR
jgi:hypothetical protein